MVNSKVINCIGTIQEDINIDDNADGFNQINGKCQKPNTVGHFGHKREEKFGDLNLVIFHFWICSRGRKANDLNECPFFCSFCCRCPSPSIYSTHVFNSFIQFHQCCLQSPLAPQEECLPISNLAFCLPSL
jgi:hypothetical protein